MIVTIFGRTAMLVNVKVNLSLCLTNHMKTYGGSRDIAPLILNLDTKWR
jgi:hypothetical protein